tara:strand:- start:183 stop:695 length:513 start_codon:yes stop_codon:yes gene_type:complete
MYNKNIYLIGMMGSGKSTIGKKLSDAIDIPLLDMDIELEKIMEMKIDTIFNEYGENRFRMIESSFFSEITKKNIFVYATGGGIILNKSNQKILMQKGTTIFLDCSLDVLYSRLKNNVNSRPILKNDFEKKINEIYNERYDIYKSCSDFIQDTSSLTPNKIVDHIRNYLNE